jgi:hypothetical protein
MRPCAHTDCLGQLPRVGGWNSPESAAGMQAVIRPVVADQSLDSYFLALDVMRRFCGATDVAALVAELPLTSASPGRS